MHADGRTGSLLPGIELMPRREPDDVDGAPDYLIYAGDHLVGRIYRHVSRSDFENWFWGLQGVFTSMEIGRLHGGAESFDQAEERLRTAFDLWLAWALAAPPSVSTRHPPTAGPPPS